MEVDNNRSVGREQALKGLFVQGVGVLTRLAENEEIVDVDDSDSDTCISENGSGCDGLKGDFDTTSDENNIGVETLVGGESFPDGCTSNAVLLGLSLSNHALYSPLQRSDLPRRQ